MKRQVKLTFFKESGKYYTEEDRKYDSKLRVDEIIDEIEQNEKRHPGMHIVLTFAPDDNVGYPCLILASSRMC